mmetsp:Transcript_3877/g.7459  ORF Transcript_3877/g.7459 Transcript_3877/m.7459 type:complete len:182 (+) Transcript_3877:362-907(+)
MEKLNDVIKKLREMQESSRQHISSNRGAFLAGMSRRVWQEKILNYFFGGLVAMAMIVFKVIDAGYALFTQFKFLVFPHSDNSRASEAGRRRTSTVSFETLRKASIDPVRKGSIVPDRSRRTSQNPVAAMNSRSGSWGDEASMLGTGARGSIIDRSDRPRRKVSLIEEEDDIGSMLSRNRHS